MKIAPVGRKRDLQIGKFKGWTEDWSTNRNQVWELWDELPPVHKHEALIRWELKYGYDPEKFAPVVSEFWITWKEGK